MATLVHGASEENLTSNSKRFVTLIIDSYMLTIAKEYKNLQNSFSLAVYTDRFCTSYDMSCHIVDNDSYHAC